VANVNEADDQLSVAMTGALDRELRAHLDKGPAQEDLSFAYWRPSHGTNRLTAILARMVPPADGDRALQGNVAFMPQYLRRVFAERPQDCGIALLHSHLGPGWQGMSQDDVVAERDRLAGAVHGQSALPLLGMTLGTDGAWSARLWQRTAPRVYERAWARSVRVAGKALRITYHPAVTPPSVQPGQVATVSVWGHQAHGDLTRARVGVIGLGSVGSIVAEALARMGLRLVTLIDFDRIQERNRDRTAGATAADVAAGLSKIQVAARNMLSAGTATDLDLRLVPASLLSLEGLNAALDCDVLISCVDRPWPRFLLNAIAYAHLIPVVDGGIMARVKDDGTPLHIDWRIHTVGPDHACMVCLDALRRSDVALDIDGQLDNPDYIQGLPESERARFSRRNIYPFSLSVAAHEALQLVGLLTGMERVGGTGAQRYHAYPGTMTVTRDICADDCEFAALTASAADLSRNLAKRPPKPPQN
jgi:molybdopterin-synthase adenylyltransferase